MTGSTITTRMRVFDATGTQLLTTNLAAGSAAQSFVAPASGSYYVGISATANTNYNPTAAGSGNAGSPGNYQLNLERLGVGSTRLSGIATSAGQRHRRATGRRLGQRRPDDHDHRRRPGLQRPAGLHDPERQRQPVDDHRHADQHRPGRADDHRRRAEQRRHRRGAAGARPRRRAAAGRSHARRRHDDVQRRQLHRRQPAAHRQRLRRERHRGAAGRHARGRHLAQLRAGHLQLGHAHQHGACPRARPPGRSA